MSGFNRRAFLRGAGGITFALPFLELTAPRRAFAQTASGPKRFVVFFHHQGTVLDQWRPTGTETNFTLPRLLAPLETFKSELTIIHGVGNGASSYLSGNDHDRSRASLLTGSGYGSGAPLDRLSGAPSIDQIIASRISGSTPFPSVNLCVGNRGGPSRNVISGLFHHGPNDPVTSTAHPQDAFNRLFAGFDDGAQQELARLRERRRSVLDAVAGGFGALRSKLGSEDRARLDAHAQKVRELEQRLTAGPSGQSCTRPTITLPSPYDFSRDDNWSAPAHAEIMAMALACNLTNVGTIFFDNGHGPQFPWLTAPDGGPVVPPSRFDTWHTMVHSGQSEPNLLAGFGFYSDQFAYLLQQLSEAQDAQGSLLESTLVLWISEFGNGSIHNRNNLPIVLAGNTGKPRGRFINHPDRNYFQRSPHDVSQLYVSILRAFGGTDDRFGRSELPTGPLAGF